jgi:single-strand DNA-binding protein
MKRLTITGNIGRDPELRLDPSGVQFATFSVAIPVGTKQNPKTDWVDVSCNGKLAELTCTYAKKGTRVLVDGYPNVNAYINKDNMPIGSLRLYAHSIELLSRTSANNDNNHDDNEHINVAPSANSDELNSEEEIAV